MSGLVLWPYRAGGREAESGDGALRNGPLFGNSLSAALEMRDAYRSFQLETFCVAERLRANAQVKGNFRCCFFKKQLLMG